jgi:hypothetical protein
MIIKATAQAAMQGTDQALKTGFIHRSDVL